ncbi:MAG: AraC family transcriptional regulator [Bacteroidales bacterium]|jgi:AraC-like DNA-binding protein|nr:AraC family transcriptional regulator [Bacteroidales bacterium]
MTHKLCFSIAFTLFIIVIPAFMSASGFSHYEQYKEKSLFYFQQKNYELAYYYLYIADSVEQIEHQKQIQNIQKQFLTPQKQFDDENKSNSEFLKGNKVIYGIFIFILIDVLGLFFFMYLQKKRTYMHLVKKNVDWAQTNTLQPNIQINQQVQQQSPPINQTDDTHKNTATINYREYNLLLRFMQLFKDEKIHLKSDINIQDVAVLLDTNKYTLSKIINAYFHKSFPSLVNEYRIKEAINLLSNVEQASVYTLEAIGEQSGFRSRQVFYMVFKRATGVTPNDFRKMLSSRDFREEYGDPFKN